MFYRAVVHINDSQWRRANGLLPDTFLSVKGWGKGLAWINGFNLGWYWPSHGPQETQYVPGPLLKAGDNELILLELEKLPIHPQVRLVAEPDFRGPHSSIVPAAEHPVPRVPSVDPKVPTGNSSRGSSSDSQAGTSWPAPTEAERILAPVTAEGPHHSSAPPLPVAPTRHCLPQGYHGPHCIPSPRAPALASQEQEALYSGSIVGESSAHNALPVQHMELEVLHSGGMVGGSSASADSSATATPGAHASSSSAADSPGHHAASASSEPDDGLQAV
eukprot:jgi/Botrbrau1/8966/Bobra.0148s0075.2